MTRRTVWTSAFLAITAAAIGMEIWAAADTSDDTSTWTQLITTWWPAPVTFAVIGILTTWIGPHFMQAYRQRSTVTGKSPTWWLQADGANRAWRTVLQGIVASALTAAGDAALQVIVASGGHVDWSQVLHTTEYTAGTTALIAVLAYLHRTQVDPSAVPSAQPPDPVVKVTPPLALSVERGPETVPRAG